MANTGTDLSAQANPAGFELACFGGFLRVRTKRASARRIGASLDTQLGSLSPSRIGSINIVQPQQPQTNPRRAIHNRQHRNLRGPVFHEAQGI